MNRARVQSRIRQIAGDKVKVRITSRRRSKGGFYVWSPAIEIKQRIDVAKTKAEAEQMLLAKIRCLEELEFQITVRPQHQGD